MHSTSIVAYIIHIFKENIYKEYLNENNIIYGDFVKDKSNLYGIDVIRIPIIKNNNSKKDFPPEINLSNNNAFFIFRDVLKIDMDLWEDGVFNARDLIRRIKYFEGETSLPEGDYAGQNAIVLNPEDNSLEDADFLSGRKAISNYDEAKVRLVLDRIKEFCNWAINNDYETIYLA